MRKATILAAAAALIGVSSVAHADGLMEKRAYKPVPVVAPAGVNWTGFYIGGGVGAGAVVHELDANVSQNYREESEIGSRSANLNFDGIGGQGVFGTLQVGYDRQIASRWVLGAFFDYDFTDAGTELNISSGPGRVKVTLDQDYMWTAGGRLGFLIHPETMIYGLAGYSETKFKGPRATVSYGDTELASGSMHLPTFGGLTLGGGFETQLHSNWFLKGEYRFSQFDKEDLFRYSSKGYSADATLAPDVHTARLVLTYKLDFLGHGHATPLK
jgi:outer membrane immunogenic protein